MLEVSWEVDSPSESNLLPQADGAHEITIRGYRDLSGPGLEEPLILPLLPVAFRSKVRGAWPLTRALRGGDGTGPVICLDPTSLSHVP